MDNPKMSCPKCGSQSLKSLGEVKDYKDLIGATCADCGAVLAAKDIDIQLHKIVDRVSRNADYPRNIK